MAKSSTIGDKVTVDNGTSEWTISAVSHDGKEVNLHVPNTNLERLRVQLSLA
jgi:hypothetical protein